ncbi:hypothetical protein KR026_006635, partial [Drosophila bipectinata]
TTLPKEVRMDFKGALLLIIFLGEVLTETNESRHLLFLNKIFPKYEKELEINTLLVFRHRRDNTCFLQNWNPSIPILRGTKASHFTILGNFNHLALAFVCIRNESDAELLGNVAEAFDSIFEGRTVLWVQTKLTQEIKAEIVKQLTKFYFHPILIMEMGEKIAVYRLEMFLDPTFIRLKNVLGTQRPLFVDKIGFKGMTTELYTDHDFVHQISKYYSNTSRDIPPRFGSNGREIVEFTQRYNITLKIDSRLNTSVVKNTNFAHLGFVNPYRSFSLIIAVPCATEISLKDIFKQLDFQTLLMYIFTVYFLLIIFEAIIQVLTRRVYGLDSGSKWITPRSIVNLRVFSSILGMGFPVSRRTSLPLRQLFLAMSVFGMVFSNFFGCKLSSLMTKHSRSSQVTNLDELRSSGLTLIVNPKVREFIEEKLDPDFFENVAANYTYIPIDDRIKMMNTFDTNFAQVVFKETFYQINKVQSLMGRKLFCTSKDLVIAENLPRVFSMKNKSYAKWLFNVFVIRIYESGLNEKWLRDEKAQLLSFLYVRLHCNHNRRLTIDDLMWTGYLLTFGYGLAIIIFLAELVFYKRQRNRRTRNNRMV